MPSDDSGKLVLPNWVKGILDLKQEAEMAARAVVSIKLSELETASLEELPSRVRSSSMKSQKEPQT